MADDRSGNRRNRNLSLNWSFRWPGGRRQPAANAIPTRIVYANPFTPATPVSEWSDTGTLSSRESSDNNLDTTGDFQALDFAGPSDVDSLAGTLSISGFSQLTIRESELSFESDAATVRAPSVADSRDSRASQASATSLRYEGML
jgi:hypothetical protein